MASNSTYICVEVKHLLEYDLISYIVMIMNSLRRQNTPVGHSMKKIGHYTHI